MKKTAVIFLIERDSKNEVFAFFPNEYENFLLSLHLCYSHVEQHSSCHILYANECKRASKRQYTPLLKELQSMGYNLEIVEPEVHTGGITNTTFLP